MPVNADIPPIDVHFLDYPDTLFSPFGARGIGELGIVGAAGAVANAIYNATGKRVRDLPDHAGQAPHLEDVPRAKGGHEPVGRGRGQSSLVVDVVEVDVVHRAAGRHGEVVDVVEDEGRRCPAPCRPGRGGSRRR